MKKFLAIAVLSLLPNLAQAQSTRNPCYYTGASPGPGVGCVPVSSINPLPVAIGGTSGGVSITQGGNTAVVKPASTSPATTDAALVVSLSPNSAGITQPGGQPASNSMPVTIGPVVLGSYCIGLTSGTIAAGIVANAPIYSFRYGGANLAIVRKVVISAADVTTAFVAGSAKFDMIAARAFSASDTGGTSATLTGNNGKLRTSYAATAVSNIQIANLGALTAGTRTLDASALSSNAFGVSTSIDATLVNPATVIYDAKVAEQPLQLVNNEGFVIQATVPGTGTWFASTNVCWDEVAAF